MKKMVMISLILVLTIALTFGFFFAPIDNVEGVAKACPTVGWNASAACQLNTVSIQVVAWTPIFFTPNVGWNG